MKLTTFLSGVLVLLLLVPAMAAVGTATGVAGPELVLLFDFQGVEGASIPDGSGHGHTGTLEAGEIVFGRTKPAVQFAGKGMVTTTRVPWDLRFSRSLTVGALCKPATLDGVIVSMGDASEGFCLYLQGGVPQFVLRAKGELHRVAATEPVELDQWVHLAGAVDDKGKLALLVNTWPAAEAQGGLLSRTPAEPLTVGADAGSFVGAYSTPLHWQGLLQDVRLYWGALSRETDRDLLAEWAIRPGCGCRK